MCIGHAGVYSSEEALIARIAEAAATTRQQPGFSERTHQSLLRRCRLCTEVGGRSLNMWSHLIRNYIPSKNTSVVLLDLQPSSDPL